MNINCSICAELFRGPDAHNLHVTRCGHVFHNECLAKWLERKSTCPECRSKQTSSTVIRLYVNIADNSFTESDGPQDLTSLQNENDNLKFKIIEKDGTIKSKEETLSRLQEDNKKLSVGQTQSRNVILALEQKLEQNKMMASAHNEQIKALKSRINEIDHLKKQLKEADEKNKTAELVQHLIIGSQKDTEELLKEGRSATELATMVTTLKRELRNCNVKRNQIRANAEELAKQLKLSKEEKVRLEEKCSILESKLYQLENKNDSKNDSVNISNNNENSVVSLLATEPVAKRKFGEHLSFPRKVARLDTGNNVSPSMCIKASSIAGLSPLLKRTKSADLHKLSPANNDKPETFSILKKPRLIQNQVKKTMGVRPLRLNKAPTLSAMTEDAASSIQPDIPKELPSTSLTTKLDNRFRLGSLSRPH